MYIFKYVYTYICIYLYMICVCVCIILKSCSPVPTSRSGPHHADLARSSSMLPQQIRIDLSSKDSAPEGNGQCVVATTRCLGGINLARAMPRNPTGEKRHLFLRFAHFFILGQWLLVHPPFLDKSHIHLSDQLRLQMIPGIKKGA